MESHGVKYILYVRMLDEAKLNREVSIRQRQTYDSVPYSEGV